MTIHAKAQRLDLSNVFLVGDSAGAHLAALSAQIHASKSLQKAYKVVASAISIKALGLSCGVYDFERHSQDDPDPMTLRLFKTVFGKRDFRKHRLYELSSVSNNLESSFPPSYVLSSKSDVPLILESEAFIKELKAHHCIVKARIMPKKLKLTHVFNIKLIHPESLEVMREMCSFFQSFTS
jgi:acetyl esterase/lipase